MNLLAVIMSLYKNDTLEYVRMAVDSVLSQTYGMFDFYIQYDGVVMDDVDNYLRSLVDKRLHIYRRQENKGLAYSLNELLGIVLARNFKYIARMDADDISMPERFERQIAFMETHQNTECLGTWAIEINPDGSEYYRKQMPVTHEECWKLFMVRDCIIHPTAMFRRSFFGKAGLYPLDTFFAEDTMIWANGFLNGCKFANLPEYLYLFRINEDFFNRRRGWNHAKGLFQLRWRINRMLHYPLKSYLFAFAYAGAKLMPKSILNLLYKTFR